MKLSFIAYDLNIMFGKCIEMITYSPYIEEVAGLWVTSNCAWGPSW